MPAFSPLATILTQNQLTRNLDIMLTAEDHIYVLSTPCPPEPPANVAAVVKREFDKWKKSNGMAHYYMLASMAGVLQHQFQSNDSAASIMDRLKGKFGDHGRPIKQVAMQRLMGAKMVKGTFVREHVLKRIGFLNELETLGATIDTQTQVDIILNSLLASFIDRKSVV